ncbi:LOW QUALITY PROTEIN: D-amino acid dehydrogenase small subunit [Geomicrobium sp. JCM 19037]|nr:LOW QUALITY PROTEIN: D-amino acid dehydrogenase small subunit [Geomicrobium sp. JCM 19037]
MRKIVIVGGGILGMSTAYELSKSDANVVVVDRQDAGQATRAAAGIICPWLSQRRNKDWYTLVKNGAAYYPKLVAELSSIRNDDTGFYRSGAIALSPSKEKRDQMLERAKKKRLDAPEIGELIPLDRDNFADYTTVTPVEPYGLYVEGGARVDGEKLVNNLRIQQKQMASQCFMPMQPSMSLENLFVDGERLEADQIVLTAGAWANEWLHTLNLQPVVSHQKAEIIHLASPVFTKDSPVLIPQGTQYIVPFSNKKIIVGTTHTDTEQFDPTPTREGIETILEQCYESFPSLTDTEVVGTRVGFRPYTENFLPAFGPFPSFPHILFANGLGSTGLTMGPYLGTVLSSMALGHAPDLDTSRYAPNFKPTMSQ